jgi:Flp pilus assembly pilin Flp
MSSTVFLMSRLARMLTVRARAAGGRDAGASALEWAVIAAIVVVAATLIGGAVFKIVQTKSEELTKCSATAVGGTC